MPWQVYFGPAALQSKAFGTVLRPDDNDRANGAKRCNINYAHKWEQAVNSIIGCAAFFVGEIKSLTVKS